MNATSRMSAPRHIIKQEKEKKSNEETKLRERVYQSLIKRILVVDVGK